MEGLDLPSPVKVAGCVPRLRGTELSYGEFLARFMMANEPVLITGLMKNWRACADWVTRSQTPDFRFFATRFGNSRVQVAECETREFTDQKRVEMTISQYVDYWEQLNVDPQRRTSTPLLYLKDWHFVKEYPEYNAYTTPEFFADDWLNFHLDNYELHISENKAGVNGNECCSDYRFVYMGPKGTWTPLHADVFRSYSWSGNICGTKIWYLLPPSETNLLYDRHKRNMVYDIRATISSTEFPDFDKTQWLECIQEAGEILFVPSGWYHQVTNMEDAISINHNWLNACNLHWVWHLLLDDYNETRKSIEDIQSIADDFEALCQRNLAANTGMNFLDFYLFIMHMVDLLLLFLRDFSIALHLKDRHPEACNQHLLPESFTVEPFSKGKLWQVLFNLLSIARTAQEIDAAELFKQSSQDELLPEINGGTCETNSPFSGNGRHVPRSWGDVIDNANDIFFCLSEQNCKYANPGATGDVLRSLSELGPLNLKELQNSLMCEVDGMGIASKYIHEDCGKDILAQDDFSKQCRLSADYNSYNIYKSVVHIRRQTPVDIVQILQDILFCFR